ncbi:DUF7521 family protein [Halopenitus persicus]|uniref:Uncharacterized protein n=1 Tax=Halopenitus persicus TaxID=1048396 RepID=A0A1H3IB12_9EURY|nr:hypothetical protein [Halopenitus persicus]QHS17042.1 hypothetical protein GWK26_07720 [haloarchaeon 3A1-DGR]SDY24837.1 hypothetical protein SAMN05216564_10453 [Halopenitus persicus]
MELVEGLYLLVTLGLVVAGLTMVTLALQAYRQTERYAMIHLSIGFSLVVAAAVATSISAFLTEFTATPSLLTVNNGLTALGFVFVVYSLVTYR